MDNTITISGNLTRDPELRFTSGGTAVCHLGVAVNSRFQANGEWQTKVSFVDVIVWRQLGENVAHSFEKGDRVMVTGRFEQRTYETQAGDRRTVHEIVASDVAASVRFATLDGITKVAKATDGEPAMAAVGADDEPF